MNATDDARQLHRWGEEEAPDERRALALLHPGRAGAKMRHLRERGNVTETVERGVRIATLQPRMSAHTREIWTETTIGAPRDRWYVQTGETP